MQRLGRDFKGNASMSTTSSNGCCGCRSGAGDPRRGFLAKLGALVLALVAYVTPAIAGLVAFLNPLRQKSKSGEFIRLAALDTLDGTPRKVAIIQDRTDAWNRYPNQPVGAVWLRKVGENEVKAIHVVCPHAGCFIDYDAANNRFVCPCHTAHFDLDGVRLDATSSSPRDLDTLEVDYETKDGVKYVLVKFQNFRIGTADKVEA
jgi:MYXO-CTERM domain-containing protein